MANLLFFDQVKFSKLLLWLFIMNITAAKLDAITQKRTNISLGAEKFLLTKKTDLPFPLSRDLVKLDNGHSFLLQINKTLNETVEVGLEAGYRSEKQKLRESIMDELGNSMVNFEYHNKMFTALGKTTYYFDAGISELYFDLGVGLAKIDINIVATIQKTNGEIENKQAESIVDKTKLAGLIGAGVIMSVANDLYLGLGLEYLFVNAIKGEDIESRYEKYNYLEDKQKLFKTKTGETSVKVLAKLII